MIHSENDVARANAIYLCHPINQVLRKLFVEKIYCVTEYYPPGSNSRFDMCWFSMDNLGRWNVFAILELKRPGAINMQAFQGPLVERSQANQALEESYEEEATSKFQDPNANKIMKQAGSYALVANTKFVACLDWQSLVLLLFDQLDYQSYTSGEFVSVQYKSDFEKGRDHGVIRRALLGFLVDAFVAKGGSLVR